MQSPTEFVPDRITNIDSRVLTDVRDFYDARRDWLDAHPDDEEIFEVAHLITKVDYHISEACSSREEDAAVRVLFAFIDTLLKLKNDGVDVTQMVLNKLHPLEDAAPKKGSDLQY